MPTFSNFHRRNVNTLGAEVRSGDWDCTHCSKLLGKRDGNRVRLRFARGHQYDCSLPATAVCRCCGTLNELLKFR